MLNEAAATAVVNLGNHVACNFFPRTVCWIRLQLRDHAYFAGLPSKLLGKWAALLCRAATTNDGSVWELLPNYSTLVQAPQPPADAVWLVNALISNMRLLMGRRAQPIDVVVLRATPEAYFRWLRFVLSDFEDRHNIPEDRRTTSRAPKLFTLTPQSSNHMMFIKISTTVLHRQEPSVLLIASLIAFPSCIIVLQP